MSTLDEKIIVVDKIINRHLSDVDTFNRGIVSQDILSHLRNFVELIMLKYYAYATGIELNNDYSNICTAIDFVKSRGDLKTLWKFHAFLQISASHYSLDESSSERLLLKYYEYLLRIRTMVRGTFRLDILTQLDRFPLDTDTAIQEYYEKIVEKVDSYPVVPVRNGDKYYVHKIKPFFVNQEIYYEITFTPANDYSEKCEHIIAFSRLEITDYYSVSLVIVPDSIELKGKQMPINIICGWEVSIRACEYNNFQKIVNGSFNKLTYSEQRAFSDFLTKSKLNLVEIVDMNDAVYTSIMNSIAANAKSAFFINTIDKCRIIISERKTGENILRLLLLHLNNRIIKKQWQNCSNPNISGLYLKNGCLPFERMPFINSLCDHNPFLRDIYSCIPMEGRDHELLGRLIINNTEQRGELFTPISKIAAFSDSNIDELIKTHNRLLWFGHREKSSLKIEYKHKFDSSTEQNISLSMPMVTDDKELSHMSKDGG